MIDFLVLTAAALVVLPVLHYWWIKIRVLRLRQDLFDQRDALFDTAARLNSLSDPAYCEARLHINSLAWVAEELSIPLISAMLLDKPKKQQRIVTSNQELQRAIDDIYKWSATRIFSYLRYETVLGRILFMASPIVDRIAKSILHDKKLDTQNVEQFVRSDGPSELSKLKKRRGKEGSVPQPV